MQHNIDCNIVNIANQFFFAYQGLILELKIFILSPTKLTKVVDIRDVFKEKQDVLDKIMTTLATF